MWMVKMSVLKPVDFVRLMVAGVIGKIGVFVPQPVGAGSDSDRGSAITRLHYVVG